MATPAERVVRFLDHVTGLASEYGITGVYALAGDALSDEPCDRIRLRVDETYGS